MITEILKTIDDLSSENKVYHQFRLSNYLKISDGNCTVTFYPENGLHEIRQALLTRTEANLKVLTELRLKVDAVNELLKD